MPKKRLIFKYMGSSRFFLYLTSAWLIFLFLFNPHYIELTGVLETWFPYKGLIYYKDFAAYHFPLGRLILLPVHVLTNWNLEYDPLLALVAGIGSLMLIYLFGKKFFTSLATSISLIFFSAIFWYAANGILFFHEILIGFLLAAILLLLFSVYKERSLSSKKLFLLGFSISLTELSGQVATATLGTIGLLIIYLVFKKTKRTLKPLLVFFSGIAVPAVALSLYFLANNAFNEFFFYNVPYYFLYAGYERYLKDLPFDQLLAFYSPLLVLLITIGINLKNKKKPNFLILSILLLSLSTIPFIVFSIYHPHHLNYALPVLALCAGFALDNASVNVAKKLAFGVGAIIFIFITATTFIPFHLSRFTFPPNMRIANDLYPDTVDPMNETLCWIVKKTTPETTIMVIGDPIFYLRSNRLPSSRPSKSIPYGWDPLEKIKTEMRAKPADYWIVDRQFVERLVESFNRKDQADFINEELDIRYKMVVSFDNWEIWKNDL